MRKEKTPESVKDISQFYENLGKILEQRGILWKDLAFMIGVKSSTLASMKSQNTNPSMTTLLKISEALEVSVDELLNLHKLSQRVFDIYWEIANTLKTQEQQNNVCEQFHLTMNFVRDTNGTQEADRASVCRARVLDRLDRMQYVAEAEKKDRQFKEEKQKEKFEEKKPEKKDEAL